MTPTIHPGKALIGELLARDWNLSEAVKVTGLDAETLTDIMLELEDITPETAAKIAIGTGVDADYWLKIQECHNAALAGISTPLEIVQHTAT